jgi:3-oxoacyl-[acyl-carrier protein] reductase
MRRNPQRKVALVTGAGGGIGRATLTALARAGMVCVALDLDPDAARSALDVLDAETESEAVVCDLSDGETARRTVEDVVRRHGAVDVLVNGAGWPGPLQGATKNTRAQWHRVMDVNYHGSVECAMAVLPSMKERRSGRIINISSLSAVQGARGQAAYSGSKAALLGFTYALAKELLRSQITVNAITPGFIRTPMTDLPDDVRAAWQLDRAVLGGEMGEPKDVAEVIAFLASDQARYITGAVIPVDGGAHLGYP